MADLLPTLHDFNLNNGLSSTREPIRRTLSKMKGMFHDQAAYEAELAKGDTLLYEFYDMGVPDSEKDVAYGTSITYPGKVGDEYHMTKGHFHTVIDTAEVYYCLRGHGYMMMETPEGKTEWLEFLPGKAVYVPGRWAHRSINVHPTEPLVTFFAFPGNAGHDYGTIESKGFRKLMVERDGKPTVIDNPRWNG
ncbi:MULTISPECIES: glucose-6-phosphate isomerase [unclassified Rhizobium]|jgi:glucose-6-phosphate isomerase|uniref:glucose-6-phosphate isomerase n=1 Tax=unclassified Rhizobium TaxID=2613769 RepID=UPI00146CEF2F|nr:MULTISPECIES: glucose-6-phosphate isomerase [unclassified Rhizobium]MBD9454990.1 glucose-6-phosphate isomerase [Rhizobium sp. RHZ02]NMN71519.1 glucose-6-phosphate isomerase [Rhizobium sp. 57MFTsu3.2]